jgi:hypothetical protein
MADVRFVFIEIQEYLNNLIDDDDFGQYQLASSINTKLDDYWNIIDKATTFPTILNPCAKTDLFKSGTELNSAVNYFRDHFEKYLQEYVSGCPLNQQKNLSSNNPLRNYFKQLKKHRLISSENYHHEQELYYPSQNININNNDDVDINNTNDINDNSEIERYLSLPIIENISPLAWWKAHEREFPILTQMAKDYLTIQATSVPCEQTFSVAGNTITRTRNRLNPETTCAILCLKSWIENEIIEQEIKN